MTPITRFSLKPDHLRLLVGSYKIVTGTAELAFGSFLLFLTNAGLQQLVDRYVLEERREDPNDFLVLFVQHHLPSVLDNRSLLGATLIVLGILKITGAIGFLFKKDWGFWMVVVVLALFLPADARQLVMKPDFGLGLFVAVHASIVYLLVRYRRAFLHQHPPSVQGIFD